MSSYGDKSDSPLTEEERRQIQRFTTDPLSFDEKFTFWLRQWTTKELSPRFGGSAQQGSQVTLAADFTNPTSAAPVVIPFDTVDHDTAAYFVTADSTFVVPVNLGGQYAVSAVFAYDDTDTGVEPAAAIFVNDVPVVVQPIPVTGTGFDLGTHMMLSRVIRLHEGDVVDVRTYKTSGTQTVMALGSTGQPAAFDIALIYPLKEEAAGGMAMQFLTTNADGSHHGFIDLPSTTEIFIEYDFYVSQEWFDVQADAASVYGITGSWTGKREDPAEVGFPNNADIDTEIRHNGSTVYTGSMAGVGSGTLCSPFTDARDGFAWRFYDYCSLQDEDADGNWTYQTYGITLDSETSPAVIAPNTWVNVGLHYTITAGGGPEPINFFVIGDPIPMYTDGNDYPVPYTFLFDNLKIAYDTWPSEGGTIVAEADFEDGTYGSLDVETDVSFEQIPGGGTAPQGPHPVPVSGGNGNAFSVPPFDNSTPTVLSIVPRP